MLSSGHMGNSHFNMLPFRQLMGENWLLATNKQIEFEKQPIKVKNMGKSPIIVEEFINNRTQKMSTCNRLDFETLDVNRLCTKISPGTKLCYMGYAIINARPQEVQSQCSLGCSMGMR